MNQYLVVYEPEALGAFPSIHTAPEISAMLEKVGDGILKVFRIRRGMLPERLVIRGSLFKKTMWLEDAYGNFIERL